MESFRIKEELHSDLVFSALSKMNSRQDALENLVKALQRKVKILANAMATEKCSPSEDLSKSTASCRENSNFAELFRLREENFELKREIQRLDHALEMARGLDLDPGCSSPILQNAPSPVYYYNTSNALSSEDSRCKKSDVASDSFTKYFEFERNVSQSRMDDENPCPKSFKIPTDNERDGYDSTSPVLYPSSTSNERQHGEKCPYFTPPDRTFTSSFHTSEKFSTNQQEEAPVVQTEVPPTKRTGRSDRIKYALRHAQSSPRDRPLSLPKRTREDIRQQLLEDAFLVLQKSGGRYIKEKVQ